MADPDEHVITRTGAIKHPESCRLSECPVLAERNRIEALEAALERIAASGWPSDFRQDPPQAIAREALDDNAR